MTTLIDDVLGALKSIDYEDYVDTEGIAEDLGASIEEDGIHLGDMRWGHIEGAVLCRGLNGQFEYVMVSQYVYSGDSDGPNDAYAHEVTPVHIDRIEWQEV